MLDVLFKAFGFMAVITMGYIGRRKNIFKDTDYQIITKLVLNITLPAAILSSFSNFQHSNILFLLTLLGFLWDIVLIFFGILLGRNGNRRSRIYYAMNCTAYNIGTFSMPFVQGFLGSQAIIATCMFDTGNAFMASGGSYAVSSALFGSPNGEHFGIRQLAKRMCNPSFIVYITAFILALLNFKMPQFLTNFLSTAANANGFLAMLMLGLTLKFDVPKQDFSEIVKLLTARYLLCAVAAVLVYFVLPFSPMIKTVLVILLFSPSSALVPLFTEMSGGNTAQASLSGSISIIISVIIMSGLMVLLT